MGSSKVEHQSINWELRVRIPHHTARLKRALTRAEGRRPLLDLPRPGNIRVDPVVRGYRRRRLDKASRNRPLRSLTMAAPAQAHSADAHGIGNGSRLPTAFGFSSFSARASIGAARAPYEFTKVGAP